MVEINGILETCHVKNTGRCKELLIPGVRVYLQESDNKLRKTRFSLIAVEKGDKVINMDSQAPNKVVYEWVKEGGFIPNITYIKPEKVYGNSRFDLYIETNDRKIFMEVKGVTLEEDGVVRFPDAPTERGIKHIRELCNCLEEGYEAYIFFVIQMKDVLFFEPNDKTHPEFGAALREAAEKGVHIIAMDCEVTSETMVISERVKVQLDY
jgi:sugar fermentation stimulation protein A